MIGLERSEQRSRFIGRERILDALADVSRGSRLTTLLGAPGIGKTRLVLELSARANREAPGAVRVVDAARAETSEAFADEVLGLLGADPAPGSSRIDAAGRALAALGATTLVLDNFDLPADTRAFVTRWLASAPELALMVTTRTRLGRTGEVLFDVPPLDRISDADSPSEAARLFVDRAANARPGVTFDAEERALVEEIVQELDGMPLAIELAAGRLRLMGLGELRARLDDPLALLVDGARKDRGRHQTLEALLEPSWQRLTENEKSALARLAGFRGAFSLASAEASFDNHSVSPLECIQSLRDQSLIAQADDGRLRVLAPIAAFARKKAEIVATAVSDASVLLEVARDGRALRAPGGVWTPLPKGSPLGRILLCLVRAHREQPGRAVPLDELVRAGWPDERMLPDAARNRAYMTMSRLRKLGLDPLIVRREDGYVIPTSVRVEYAEMPR